MSIAERVRDAVEPLLADRHLDLVDIEHRGSQLRVTIDRAGGVDLEAVSEATKVVSRALDELDPIPGRYTLEVSSPGLERNLRLPQHFARAVGETVSVKTAPDIEGDRRVKGTLVSSDEAGIVVRADDGTERRFEYGEIEKARTVFEWGQAARPHSRKKADT